MKLTECIVGAIEEACIDEGVALPLKAEALARAIEKAIRPGAAGEFPEGKLNAQDEGQLRLILSADDTQVRIDLGKAVAWISMPKSQALTFAFGILEKCGVQIEHKVQQNPASGEPV